MTDEQVMLRESMSKILGGSEVQSNGAAYVAWPSESWGALENAGMTSVGIDEAYGGSGGTLADAASLVLEVGRHASPIPLPETILLAGWLDGLAKWHISGAVETVAISDLDSVVVVRIGSRIETSGHFYSVPWARFAQRILAVVETTEETLLLALTKGDFQVQANENLAGEPRDTVVMNNVTLDGNQWQVSPVSTTDVRRRGALTRSIAMVGSMESVLEMTVRYAEERKQFGRSISQFQAIQHLCARLAEEVFASSMAVRSALVATEGGSGMLLTMAAAVRVSQGATQVARIAHQIHGAIGITNEYPLHQYTNRLWSWRDEFGGELQWCQLIAQILRVESESKSLWSLLSNQS